LDCTLYVCVDYDRRMNETSDRKIRFFSVSS
jgi:hypothetical protein